MSKEKTKKEKRKQHAHICIFHVSHGPRNIVKHLRYHFWKNKISQRAEKDDTIQINKAMTNTAWEGRLWGSDSDMYFFLILSEMYTIVSLKIGTNIITTD